MQKESRTQKSLLNMRVNLACYFVNIVVSFFTRKVFLDQLGKDFVGLTSTLHSLLGFLNIAELGVAAAISYFLYKPLFEGDKKKIEEIVSVFGFLYRLIGLLILGGGIVLSLFLSRIFAGTEFSYFTLFVGFYSYLFVAMLGYFVNYKQTLLTADQRNYEVTGLNQTIIAIKSLAQMVLAYKYQSYILFFSLEAIFGITYSIILNGRIRKTYPWLTTKISSGKLLLSKYPEIKKKIGQICIHKIGGFVQFQLMPILIYAYVSLPIVALYTNYTTLTNALRSMINAVLYSSNAGVGSLVAEGNTNKIMSVYKGIFAIDFLVSAIFAGCVYEFISFFIEVWLGKEYILGNMVVFLICAQLFLAILRLCTDQFVAAYGLFSDTWAPIVESVLFVGLSMLCGSLWGLVGILMGPVVSTLLIIHVWKPYFLFSRGIKVSVFVYWKLFLKHAIALFIVYNMSSYLIRLLMSEFSLIRSWESLVLYSTLHIICITLLGTIFSCFISSDFREIAGGIIKRTVRRIFNK